MFVERKRGKANTDWLDLPLSDRLMDRRTRALYYYYFFDVVAFFVVGRFLSCS